MFKMNALVPELIVSDLAKSLAFYCQVAGFSIEYERPEDKFAYLSFGQSQIMLEEDWHSDSPWRVGPLERPFGRGMNLSIVCPDAHALANALQAAGHALRRPVEEHWYRNDDQLVGQRNFLVQDPDGYLLRFAEELGIKHCED
ncbi:VOC family protein [Pseudomonas purpurea]|uniref:bleomycin resistance protein n=1 Tax=Pseudomonas purpurea TaxID=3136737 RepID=UPI0032635B9C